MEKTQYKINLLLILLVLILGGIVFYHDGLLDEHKEVLEQQGVFNEEIFNITKTQVEYWVLQTQFNNEVIKALT